MQLFRYIYILLSYVLILLDARRNFDIVLHKKNEMIKENLRNALLNTNLEILWKISNKQVNILQDLIDDVLHDVELKRVLFHESIIYEKYSFVNSANIIIVMVYDDDLYKFCDKFNNNMVKYLVLIDEFDVNKIKEFLKMFFNNGIVDVTVGILNDSIKFYTWFPFNDDSNCGETINLQLVSNEAAFYLFPQKVTRFLPNCTITSARIDAAPFSVLYGKVFKHVSDKTGSNLRFLNKDIGFKYYWEDTMQTMFENDKVDVIFGYTFINSSDFAYGPMFYTDVSYVAVRKAPRILTYHPLLKVFNIYIFLYILCTYIFLSVLIISVQNKNINVEIFLIFFRICLGNSTPVKSYEHVTKTLFISYSFYSLILGTVYLSKLSSLLTNPAYEEPVASREDLYINNLQLLFNHYYEKIYCIIFYASDNADALENSIMTNLSFYNLLLKEVNEQNHSVLSFVSLLESYPHLTVRIDYFPSFFDEATLFHSYVLNKNNPKNEVINYWATEMIEKGLMIKWWNDIKLTSLIESYKYMLNNTGKPFTVLNLSHLNESFLIIIYGYIFSITIFVFEFFTYFLMKRINLMRDISLV